MVTVIGKRIDLFSGELLVGPAPGLRPGDIVSLMNDLGLRLGWESAFSVEMQARADGAVVVATGPGVAAYLVGNDGLAATPEDLVALAHATSGKLSGIQGFHHLSEREMLHAKSRFIYDGSDVSLITERALVRDGMGVVSRERSVFGPNPNPRSTGPGL